MYLSTDIFSDISSHGVLLMKIRLCRQIVFRPEFFPLFAWDYDNICYGLQHIRLYFFSGDDLFIFVFIFFSFFEGRPNNLPPHCVFLMKIRLCHQIVFWPEFFPLFAWDYDNIRYGLQHIRLYFFSGDDLLTFFFIFFSFFLLYCCDDVFLHCSVK